MGVTESRETTVAMNHPSAPNTLTSSDVDTWTVQCACKTGCQRRPGQGCWPMRRSRRRRRPEPGMHDSAQQQTFGIYPEMTLLAPDLLSRVMAIRPPPPAAPSMPMPRISMTRSLPILASRLLVTISRRGALDDQSRRGPRQPRVARCIERETAHKLRKDSFLNAD
jgi:hypothetical protein